MSAQSRMNFCVTSNEHFKSDINKSKYVFLQLGTNQRDQKKKKKRKKICVGLIFIRWKGPLEWNEKEKKKEMQGTHDTFAWHVRGMPLAHAFKMLVSYENRAATVRWDIIGRNILCPCLFFLCLSLSHWPKLFRVNPPLWSLSWHTDYLFARRYISSLDARIEWNLIWPKNDICFCIFIFQII